MGWGRLLRGSWTVVFCQRRVLNEKTVQEEKREAEEATDSWLRWFVLLVYSPSSIPASTINEIHLSKTKHSSMYKVMGWESQSCFTASHVAFLLSVLFAVSVSKFLVSFCLIRNLTMFSLVKKKKLCREKQRSSHLYSAVMFFSLIQFEASPTGAFYCFFFFMLPWHLSYSESTLWNLWLKKKKEKKVISVPDDVWRPQDTPLCSEPV